MVVGAGLAGLAATQRLSDAGWRVTLLEASDRPGGRARTERAFRAGQYADSGAEWIDDTHHRLLTLVDEFGLELEPDSGPWSEHNSFVFRHSTLRSYADILTSGAGVELDRFYGWIDEKANGIPDAAHPSFAADAEVLDALSMADLIALHNLGDDAQFSVTRHVQSEYACEPHDISVLFVVQQEALALQTQSSDGQWSRRLAGGLDQIPREWARRLGKYVTYGAHVTSIEASDKGVVVATATGELVDADCVIVTVPFPVVRAITIAPPLPATVARAVAELGMGTITKVFVQYDQRVWRDHDIRDMETDLAPQRFYEPTVAQPGSHGILTAYVGGQCGAAMASKTPTERERDVASGIAEIVPGAASCEVAWASQAWPAEPLSRGAYAVYAPGQVTQFWEAIRQPAGRVVFAGEHTATVTGYMEGAIESGYRAADQSLNLWG